MTMAWVAVGTAVLGAGASYLGSKKQADASKAAANLNTDWLQTMSRQQQPFIQSGYGAMGKLSTLLGINPNPNYRPQNQGGQSPGSAYMPTPGGGVRPIMQAGNQQPPNQGAQFGIPENAQNMRLNRILSIRAANGDTQAASMLNRLQG